MLCHRWQHMQQFKVVDVEEHQSRAWNHRRAKKQKQANSWSTFQLQTRSILAQRCLREFFFIGVLNALKTNFSASRNEIDMQEDLSNMTFLLCQCVLFSYSMKLEDLPKVYCLRQGVGSWAWSWTQLYIFRDCLMMPTKLKSIRF